MANWLADHLDDLMFFGGLALLGAGLFFVYWPLALIVPGSLLAGVGLLMSIRGGS